MENSSIFLMKMEELVKQVVRFYNIPCYLVDSNIETHTNPYGEKVRIPVVRVVGFFEDTIAKVAHLLNAEFDLLVIKDTNASTDSFTSSGQTYQAGLKQNRLDLPEYKLLSPHKFEIHVSSILQDVYTAMQKGLSNGSQEVPPSVKRDFYRVGAFLEMADIEFLKIRDQVSSSTGTTQPNTIPDIPQVARTTQVVAPLQTPPPAAVVAPPAPEPLPLVIPEPVATMQVSEPIKITTSEADSSKIEAIDMSVDSFNSLAVNINNIENKKGADDNYLDLINAGKMAEASDDVVIPAFNTDVLKEEEPVSTPKPAGINGAASDAVALNIDNIETFNMNVSGMIERTTEIIREVGDKGSASTSAAAEVPDENTQMNEATLKEYVRTNKLVKEVDAMVAEKAGAKINDEIDIEGDVERLRFLKVNTLKQLHERISDNKEDIVAFAEKWIGKDNGGSFDSGICLFYLEYLLVGKKNDPAFAVEYVLKFISDNDYSARYIIPTYNSIRHNGEPASFAHLTLK
jgi:hypothetical protein